MSWVIRWNNGSYNWEGGWECGLPEATRYASKEEAYQSLVEINSVDPDGVVMPYEEAHVLWYGCTSEQRTPEQRTPEQIRLTEIEAWVTQELQKAKIEWDRRPATYEPWYSEKEALLKRFKDKFFPSKG
jgi:hypothetical protein